MRSNLTLPGLLSLVALAACAAPVDDDEAGASADAVKADASASAALAGRYVPDDDGRNPALLDVALPRETPRQAAVVGRLRVAPADDRDVGNLEKTCTLSFSGVLEKPREDGPVDVDVEVADVTGTSPGKLRFSHVSTFAGIGTSRQRVVLSLERPSRACELALGPRGSVKEGVTFVWNARPRSDVLSFGTLTREIQIRGIDNPSNGVYHPIYALFRGEPVEIYRRNDRGVLVGGMRVDSRGEGGGLHDRHRSSR